MSPASTVTREQSGVRTPKPPYPPRDVLLRLAREIVVDWQLPSESDRKS
jgi:hypothetical protein